MLVHRNRTEVGRQLADRLRAMALPRPVVLALPRGGVPIGVEIARALGAPIDLLLVRKIGAPDQPELAVGAVVEGEPPALVVNRDVQSACGMSDAQLQAAERRELAEIARRRAVYLGGRAPLPLAGTTAIVVDDGIATGASVRAALRALRRRGPSRVVLATGVAAADTLDQLRGELDDVVCLATPAPLHAIGLHYEDFTQLDDAQVVSLLRSADTKPTGTGVMP
ncbi:MAG: phosphoribosyltransferase [Lautropia sp.]